MPGCDALALFRFLMFAGVAESARSERLPALGAAAGRAPRRLQGGARSLQLFLLLVFACFCSLAAASTWLQNALEDVGRCLFMSVQLVVWRAGRIESNLAHYA